MENFYKGSSGADVGTNACTYDIGTYMYSLLMLSPIHKNFTL